MDPSYNNSFGGVSSGPAIVSGDGSGLMMGNSAKSSKKKWLIIVAVLLVAVVVALMVIFLLPKGTKDSNAVNKYISFIINGSTQGEVITGSEYSYKNTYAIKEAIFDSLSADSYEAAASYIETAKDLLSVVENSAEENSALLVWAQDGARYLDIINIYINYQFKEIGQVGESLQAGTTIDLLRNLVEGTTKLSSVNNDLATDYVNIMTKERELLNDLEDLYANLDCTDASECDEASALILARQDLELELEKAENIVNDAARRVIDLCYAYNSGLENENE